jgi:hypothetical protein
MGEGQRDAPLRFIPTREALHQISDEHSEAIFFCSRGSSTHENPISLCILQPPVEVFAFCYLFLLSFACCAAPCPSFQYI